MTGWSSTREKWHYLSWFGFWAFTGWLHFSALFVAMHWNYAEISWPFSNMRLTSYQIIDSRNKIAKISSRKDVLEIRDRIFANSIREDLSARIRGFESTKCFRESKWSWTASNSSRRFSRENFFAKSMNRKKILSNFVFIKPLLSIKQLTHSKTCWEQWSQRPW